MPPAVEVQSLNHSDHGEVPGGFVGFFFFFFFFFLNSSADPNVQTCLGTTDWGFIASQSPCMFTFPLDLQIKTCSLHRQGEVLFKNMYERK